MAEDTPVLLVWLETQWEALNVWLERQPWAASGVAVEVGVENAVATHPSVNTAQTLLAVTLPTEGWSAVRQWAIEMGTEVVGPAPKQISGPDRAYYCLGAHLVVLNPDEVRRNLGLLSRPPAEHPEPALLSVASIRRILRHYRQGAALRARGRRKGV